MKRDRRKQERIRALEEEEGRRLWNLEGAIEAEAQKTAKQQAEKEARRRAFLGWKAKKRLKGNLKAPSEPGKAPDPSWDVYIPAHKRKIMEP